MRVMTVGCVHGDLDRVYATAAREQADLVLLCGDVQTPRNERDLACLKVPVKYRSMGSFPAYYAKGVPVLTVMIGGNHEASNVLQECPYGGYIAPNLFFLGRSGCIQVGGLRIAGVSGIYKKYDFHRGTFEVPPYDHEEMATIFHVRELDLYRLGMLSGKVDMMLSHDWPTMMAKAGETKKLLRVKRHFKPDVCRDALGNPYLNDLVYQLRPRRWNAAHLHVCYRATVTHSDTVTEFTALDKVLPGSNRPWFEVLELGDATTDPRIIVDPQWLAILRDTVSLESMTRRFRRLDAPTPLPSDTPYGFEFTPSFSPTPTYETFQLNPQTHALLRCLGLPNPFWAVTHGNEEEILLD